MRYILPVIWVLLLPLLSALAGSQVELELKLDREHYLARQDNSVYLKASIKAAFDEAEGRQVPVNLALVVDRSGSMAGPKIAFARESLKETLSRLSPQDIVSIITYGSEVNTVIDAQSLDGLGNQNILIEQIEAEGGSAQYEALTVAAAQLRRHLNDGGINRLVFMTDGQATSGLREKDDFIRLTESLAREGIVLTTIGLGEAFDEDLLKQMAEIGGGNFYFAKTGEDLQKSYLLEIQQLNPVVANNLSLRIQFKGGIKPEEILGREGKISGSIVTISLGQLLRNENQFVLVSANIPGRISFLDSTEVAEAELVYESTDALEANSMKQSSSVTAFFTDYRPRVIRSINHEVVWAVVSHEIAESIQKAISFADEGKLERSIRELKGTLRDLKILNLDLEDKVIDQAILDLQAYIQTIESRGLNRIDRKVMTLRVYQAIRQRSTRANPENSEPSNNRSVE